MEIVLKISEGCNLACEYCYFYFRGNQTFENNPALIRPEVVGDLLGFLKRSTATTDFSVVQIDFHGGEPLLYPKKRFAALCADIRRSIPDGVRVVLNVQTNGTLIDDEWIDIFSEHEVVVGISLDGPELVNDRYRVTKKGAGSYAKAVRGLRLAQKAAAEGRLVQEPAILCVYNFSVPIEDVVNHFVNDLGVLHFNLLLDDLTHDNFEKNEHFRTDLYTTISAAIDGFGKVIIPNQKFAEGQMKIRAFNGAIVEYDNLRNIIITVSSNGDIAASDQVRICGDEYCYQGLNVRDAELRDIISSDAYAAQHRAFTQIPEGCADCCWRNICRGGDLVHRHSKERGFDNPSVYCDILQDLYGLTAASLMKGGRSLSSIEKSLGLTAEEAAR